MLVKYNRVLKPRCTALAHNSVYPASVTGISLAIFEAVRPKLFERLGPVRSGHGLVRYRLLVVYIGEEHENGDAQ